jgi:hypothetical protein
MILYDHRMSQLDNYRFSCLRALAKLDARTKPWPGYREELQKILGESPTAQDVFNIGAQLKQVFKSEARTRSQSDLSRGGGSWEILITWYLNLVFWDTNVVVMRPKKKLLPSVVADAMAVKVKGVTTSKETDVIVIEVPENNSSTDLDTKSIDQIIRSDPQGTSVGVVQCKTNWNDNAQIPMLWNIVYAAQNLQVQNVVVGSNGFSPSSFGKFSYAFMTVPTNTEKNGKDNFNPGSTAVVRVQGMTGGNYWGNPSQSGVADSVSEYFGRNFDDVFEGGVQKHITSKLLTRPDVIQKFLNFDF